MAQLTLLHWRIRFNIKIEEKLISLLFLNKPTKQPERYQLKN